MQPAAPLSMHPSYTKSGNDIMFLQPNACTVFPVNPSNKLCKITYFFSDEPPVPNQLNALLFMLFICSS